MRRLKIVMQMLWNFYSQLVAAVVSRDGRCVCSLSNSCFFCSLFFSGELRQSSVIICNVKKQLFMHSKMRALGLFSQLFVFLFFFRASQVTFGYFVAFIIMSKGIIEF